jgi:two-component system alkaline phosphatase synthesis response regulator PhoP/two-component system response regulator ResD
VTRPQPGPRVLVADDDESIAELVRLYLARQGYGVELAYSGSQVLARLKDGSFDLLVLDIMMPGASGLQVLRELRAYSDLPVIFLTARSMDIDKIAGLQLGADDYVTKPFNPWELVARVEAVLRRQNSGPVAAAPQLYGVGSLQVDLTQRRVTVAGKPVDMAPKEFDLLATMVRLPNVMLDRTKLLELVWGNAYFTTRTIDVHVVKLRTKLAGSGVKIETVWGSGYRLVEVENGATAQARPL